MNEFDITVNYWLTRGTQWQTCIPVSILFTHNTTSSIVVVVAGDCDGSIDQVGFFIRLILRYWIGDFNITISEVLYQRTLYCSEERCIRELIRLTVGYSPG